MFYLSLGIQKQESMKAIDAFKQELFSNHIYTDAQECIFDISECHLVYNGECIRLACPHPLMPLSMISIKSVYCFDKTPKGYKTAMWKNKFPQGNDMIVTDSLLAYLLPYLQESFPVFFGLFKRNNNSNSTWVSVFQSQYTPQIGGIATNEYQ